jgi:prepilin-type N-terminal cleavage/methylation domain-containing protein
MKNYFQKKDRKAFTIVELVIVIAVIAILAAVLIPTFSNIIKKANLSADKQAVREMNQALAEYEASSGYTALVDVESVMRVLANAGYNTNNWRCLTAGYEVFWYQNDNRMILYNASEAAIEYPEEYIGTKVMVTAENNFFLYNNNQIEAQSFDMGFKSISASSISGKSDLASVTAVVADANTSLTSVSSENIVAIQSAINTNSAISSAVKSSTGGNASSSIYYYATREVKKGSENAYVSMQVAAVGTQANPVILESTGTVQENLYYINPVISANASEIEIKNAQKETAKLVYTIFTQMTTGTVSDQATVILAPGTVLDCSANEWAPCKTFSGYFGTANASEPVIIDGARLTDATGHASTVAFNGSGSKYFVTGFFGTIYGDTTIENVTFKNININKPASDYELTESDISGKLTSTRNTVGIIGGITDNYSESNTNGTEAKVVLSNITVENTCSVCGNGCAGGLVGYIGSTKSKDLNLRGTVTIKDCKIHESVVSLDNSSGSGYRACGGILGFCCRVGDTNLTINFNNNVFDGSLEGFGYLGAVAGAFQNKRVINISGGNYSGATINSNNTAWKVASIAGYCENPAQITVNGATLKDGIAASHNSTTGTGNVDYTVLSTGKLG